MHYRSPLFALGFVACSVLACSTSLKSTSGSGGGGANGTTSSETTSSDRSSTATGGAGAPLVFAAVGDTRPAIPDDVPGYPTAIIQTIFTAMGTLPTKPMFVIGTGDYQFSDPLAGLTAGSQFDIYVAAAKMFDGPFYPAMGNHECNGLTTSNCGQGNADGVTAAYTAFLQKMLTPISQTAPYFVQHEQASDSSWTAKFVFIAANAWNAAQATWLDTALAEPTTYTFVVRHEPASANTAPGVTPSEAIMAKHPYTLALVGHVHTFQRTGPREVTIGNGGAPLDTSVNYGFGLFTRRSDGAINVEMIDYQSGMSSQAFAVNPDGSPAP